MNNVILNGVNSNTIAGLIIQELPPISKPLMRTEIEEIDGRDGDIITKLGYSAYDKVMRIGLRNDSIINDVIKFFDSEGQVIFSNESDKYYRYKILDQIDFDRLLRYRTADVTFHVQPFKYSATEQTLTKTSFPATVTNSGNTIAMPTLTISGSGTIGIRLAGEWMFTIDMSNISQITIDTEKMEAYSATDGVLLNRRVTGDYTNFRLQVGSNSISKTGTGTLSQMQISNYSRWI